MRGNNLRYRDETATLFAVNSDSIWGADGDRPWFATPERALVDAVNHPRYGVRCCDRPTSGGVEALCGLSGEFGDQLEVFVDVEHGEPG